MVRAFTAVDIEDEKVLKELEHVRDSLDLGFSPVEREKMHITLEFFKDIDQEELEKVKQAMKDISVESFNAEVKGVGSFPSREFIRVIWAGVEAEELHELEQEISQNSVKSDNSYDFKPHVTLMRVKNIGKEQKNRLRRSIRDFKDHYFGKIKINSVKLFRSDFKGGESAYKELYQEEI